MEAVSIIAHMENLSMRGGKFLDGRLALVTGGGRGIGRAVALRLAALGAETLVAGPTQAHLDETAGLIRAAGGKAGTARADVSDENDVLALFAEAGRRGKLDILINNAGIGRFMKIVDTSAGEWDRVLAVNLRGAFLCAREAMRAMAGRGGRIINVSSVVGIKGYPNQGAYTASKHGLIGLSKVMAVEGQADGIITQVVAPGGVDTDLASQGRPDLDRAVLITPDDIADAVEYLLGQDGNAVTDMIQIRRKGNAPW